VSDVDASRHTFRLPLRGLLGLPMPVPEGLALSYCPSWRRRDG